MIHKLIVSAIMFCLCRTAEAYGPLRCEGKMIRTGVTRAQVLDLCSTPETRIIEEVPVKARTLSGFSRFIGVTTTEQRVYDRGWGRVPAVLHFHDGRLQRIDYLPYRYEAR